MCEGDKCFKDKKDIWYTIMPLAVTFFIFANILYITQASIGMATDPCTGLDRPDCTGIGQPCLKWTGRPCNETVSVDNGRRMCAYKAKACRLNLNWFNKDDTWKRDQPAICKITERMSQSQTISSSSLALFVGCLLGIFIVIGYVVHVIFVFTFNNKTSCQIIMHQLFTGFIIFYSIVMIALDWMYYIALEDTETGCLIIDDDRDGWVPWPDNDANPFGQYFQEVYFKAPGVLGWLVIGRLLYLVSAGLFSFQLFYWCSNKDDLIVEVQKIQYTRLEMTGRSKRTFT